MLEYVPIHVIEWKAYYEGFDARGRVRQRTASGKALVLSDGRIIDDIGKQGKSWLVSEVKRKSRLRYGKVRATKLVKGKGIPLNRAKRIVKSEISAKYDCSARDVSIISWKTMYLGLNWIVEFGLTYSSGKFEVNMLKDKEKIILEPLDTDTLKSIIAENVRDRVNEELINIGTVQRKGFKAKFKGETARFTVESEINAYSGKIINITTRFKKEAVMTLVKALVPEGKILNIDERVKEIIVDVEDKELLHVITIDSQTGKYHERKGLTHTKALPIVEEFLKKRYELHELKVLKHSIKDHRFWKFDLFSPETFSITVSVDAFSGDIASHEVLFNENRVAKEFRKEHPEKTIINIKFNGKAKTFHLKALKDKHMYEYEIDAATLGIKLLDMYLREDKIVDIVTNTVKGMNDELLNIVEKRLTKKEWIVKVETPAWYRTFHIDKVHGVIVKSESVLKKEGAYEYFKQYIILKYGKTKLELIQVKQSSERPNAYVVKLKDDDDNYYYAFVDKYQGKIIEHDVLRKRKGIRGWMKSKLSKARLELKYR